VTPAERIATALRDWQRNQSPPMDTTLWIDKAEQPAGVALDALCPKGQRVVLDRTGDTDRLIRQQEVIVEGVHDDVWIELVSADVVIDGSAQLWVDSPEGGEQ